MPAGIYIHIPFCRSRCSYCDFATDVFKNEETVERYVNALVREVNTFAPPRHAARATPPRQGGELWETRSLPLPVLTSSPVALNAIGSKSKKPHEGGTLNADTIYFGGGTPSLLTPKQLEKILRTVHDKFNITENPEVTMEMNPATVTPETLRDYKSLGVNRASFGAQTFDDTELKRLGRKHTANDVRETIALLRDAGFANVSFDLIAGLPRQTMADWERNLSEAIKLAPEHISLYLLEVHEGTPLAEQIRSGRQPVPDEDLAAAMYETLLERTAAAGYAQYEISNFSRPGFESRHNLKYWQFDPYYSFGCSAHSFDGVTKRWANERDTAKYVSLIEAGGSATVEAKKLNGEEVRGEYVFLTLRLNQGLDLLEYSRRFGRDLKEEFSAELDEFRQAGLIEIAHDTIKLTAKGRLYSNEVFSVFA